MESIMVLEPSSDQTVLCTRANGVTVKNTVGGNSSASTAPTTKGSGRKEGTTDEVSYSYQEARSTLAPSSMAGSLAEF